MRTIQLVDIDLATMIDEFIPLNEWVMVMFENNEQLKLPSRKVVLLAYYWKIVRKWGFQITPRYVIDTAVVNSTFLSKIGTLILDDVIEAYPEQVRELNQDLWVCVNEINALSSNHCQEYVRSINALDFIKIKRIPEVKEIIADKVTDLSMGHKAANIKIDKNTNALFDALKKPHPDNAFYPFINLKLVNVDQIGHIFYQVGLRTDINGNYIGEPVIGNYWDGIRTRNEYVYEALAAKKSVFYNKMQLPTADYFGRKQHLALSSLHTLHHKDCGTKLTNEVMITELNKSYMLWKYIIDGDRLVLLTTKTIGKYIGSLVKMRSPLTCRFTDGVCEVCGGALLSVLHPSINLGVFSGTKISQTVVQTVLKTKHISKANVLDYVIPADVTDIFKKVRTSLYIKRTMASVLRNATIVLSPEEAIHVLNLKKSIVHNLKNINVSSFGSIRYLTLKMGDEIMRNNVDMMAHDQQPLFSKEFHIPMEGFDFKNPLFGLIMEDYSMVKFVKEVEKFLERDVSKYTDISEAFSDFCELIYRQVTPNIAYLEIVLRATMAVSPIDVRIPVVSDVHDVTIVNNVTINRQRSVGTALAFEDLFHCLLDPKFYLMPKPYNPFDDLLNLKPIRR